MRNSIKVLIVDDDKALGQTLSEMVKRMGYKPVVCNKPSDALNVVRLQTVQAAIVDVLLPKMTGVELVEEFRRTKFGDAPVVFISGVFKDKAFAADTLKKTAAAGFLFKPFEVDELTQLLQKAMEGVVGVERWSVSSLLTRRLKSDRERAKAIEYLVPIKGLDFPFVLGILMEVGSSGHLNIVNDTGEIFGVSLIKGTISEVDSTESQSTGVLALISKGFLSQEDWEEFQKSGARKFSLEKLVAEGYVSPHAVSEARREQILYDLRSICSAEVLQINFVPQEDGETAPKHAVNLGDLLDLMQSSVDEFFPEAYLKDFYAAVVDSPTHVSCEEAGLNAFFNSPVHESYVFLKEILKRGGTLHEALAAVPGAELTAYRGVHHLVLSRIVMFDDLNRARNLNSMLDRYQKLYGELKGKTPDKVFEYFGANANSSANVIQTIFDEYAKSNQPDHLGTEATPELKELCQKCFNIVREAAGVLTNDSAKALLMADIRGRAVEKQQQAQQLMNDGLALLRKGQAREAFERLKAAEALLPSPRLSFISAWAEIKAGANTNKPRLHELAKKIDAYTSEERKSAFYYMASGLVKRYLGDPLASAAFEKALQMDPEFVEARRESHSLSTAPGKQGDTKKLDLFTGDITEIVSQLFRRKAD